MKNSRFTDPPVSKNCAGRTALSAAAELLRQATAMAERELSQVPENKDDPGIRKAMKIVEIAEANWQEAWDASQRMPGIIQPGELKRLRLAAEVGWLRLDKALANRVQSTRDRMKSALEELYQTVLQLQTFRAKLVSSRMASKYSP